MPWATPPRDAAGTSARRTYGEIRDYLSNGRERGRQVGLPTDDTQLAFWTLEHLIEGPFEPGRLAKHLAVGRIVGIGDTVQQFQWKSRGGAHWSEAGGRSAANGAIMRIAPMLVPHVSRPSGALWGETALAADDHATTTPRRLRRA